MDNLIDAASGDLAHAWTAGQTEGSGFADDYAATIAALLDLYDATLDPSLIVKGVCVCVLVDKFTRGAGMLD